jgi:shikimate dehydrogenase
MLTFEMQRRGLDAVLVPLHVRVADFDRVLPGLLHLHNLDGLVFTIPFKARAAALATRLGPQAQALGVINVLARQRVAGGGHAIGGDDGKGSEGSAWVGEMFDGLGCVEGLRRHGVSLQGKAAMLIGLGGAGSAIAAAVAHERPRLLRIHDLDPARCERLHAIVHPASWWRSARPWCRAWMCS